MADEKTAVMETDIAASIAAAGTPDYKPVTATQEKEVPTATATETKPSDSKKDIVPAVEGDAKPEVDASKPDTGKGWVKNKPANTADASDKLPERTPEETAEIARRDALGLSQTEPDTPAVLKKRYEESSREAHRLVSESKSVKKTLADAGLELAKSADGKFYLKPTEKYGADLKIDGDVDQIYGSLTDEEKALLDSDDKKFVSMIAKKVAVALHAKRPAVQTPQGIEEAELDETQVEGAFDTIFNAKTLDGRKRFPEAETAEIQGHMRMLYDDPKLSQFRKWMNGSKENFTVGLEMLHNRVAYALAPLKAAQKDAEEKRKREIQKQQNTVATGGGSPAGTVTGKSGKMTPDEIAASIANATYT